MTLNNEEFKTRRGKKTLKTFGGLRKFFDFHWFFTTIIYISRVLYNVMIRIKQLE